MSTITIIYKFCFNAQIIKNLPGGLSNDIRIMHRYREYFRGNFKKPLIRNLMPRKSLIDTLKLGTRTQCARKLHLPHQVSLREKNIITTIIARISTFIAKIRGFTVEDNSVYRRLPAALYIFLFTLHLHFTSRLTKYLRR